MTISDYLISVLLIAVVVRQVRGKKLTPVRLLWPVGLVAYFAFHYLKGVPSAGNDLVLVAAGVVAGLVFGIGCALATRITAGGDGVPVAKAGAVAAILWMAGLVGRLAFQLYATHGGGAAIGRFSAAHSITSARAWVAALILMALAEVVGRSAVLAWRGWIARVQPVPPGLPAPAESDLPAVTSARHHGGR